MFYISAISNCINFRKAMSRSDFWMFFAFAVFLPFATLGIFKGQQLVINILAAAFLFHSIILISAIIRRLHDTGLPGWWLFTAFIPLVGPLILIYLLLKPSDANGPYKKTAPANDFRL